MSVFINMKKKRMELIDVVSNLDFPTVRATLAPLSRAPVCVCVCVCERVCVCVGKGGSERRGSGSISSISSLIRLHRGRVYIR